MGQELEREVGMRNSWSLCRLQLRSNTDFGQPTLDNPQHKQNIPLEESIWPFPSLSCSGEPTSDMFHNVAFFGPFSTQTSGTTLDNLPHSQNITNHQREERQSKVSSHCVCQSTYIFLLINLGGIARVGGCFGRWANTTNRKRPN